MPPAQLHDDRVQNAASHLSDAVLRHFTTCSQVAAVDVSALDAANNATADVHAALHHRLSLLLASAHQANDHLRAAPPLVTHLNTLLQKAHRLEAIVQRLDEYTAKQEAALSNNHSSPPATTSS